jgi:hypothetical protein
MRTLLGLLAVSVLVTGCQQQPAEPAAPTTFTVSGQVVILAATPGTSGTPCKGGPTYEDFTEGAQVTVADNAGVKVAVASMKAGKYPPPKDGDALSYLCQFGFEVPNVPEGKPLYDIQAGRESRGSVTYQRGELNEPLTITLG